jgi:hypothetical protein
MASALAWRKLPAARVRGGDYRMVWPGLAGDVLREQLFEVADVPPEGDGEAIPRALMVEVGRLMGY